MYQPDFPVSKITSLDSRLGAESNVRRSEPIFPKSPQVSTVLIVCASDSAQGISFEKKIFHFFLSGDPVQNRQQNPAPAGCLFSTRKSGSEVPEKRGLGEENCLGKGGVDRAKTKRKRDAQKKVVIVLTTMAFRSCCSQ